MPRLPQLAWNAGEIAEEQQGRVDLAKYAGGANFIINLIPLVAGGLERRPGFGYLGNVKDHDNAPRIEPFIYRDDQAYVIELGDQYARFWMLGGQIYANTPNFLLTTLSGDRLTTLAGDGLITLQLDPTAAPYEIVTPWLQASLEAIQTAQAADVMWLFRDGYEPRTLSRTAHSNWTLEKFQPTGGPFMDRNETTTTITPSGTAVGSSITLTASVALFDPEHVGALWRIEEYDTNGYAMWEPAKAYALNDIVRYGSNVYLCTDAGTSGAVAPVHIEGARYDGSSTSTAAAWTYLHSGHGVARVTAYTSATVVTAEVLSLLPSTSATRAWREGAWSDYRGWPRAVVLFQQRLWAAATFSQPQTVWGSVGGNFFDFTPGDLDDDAVTFTLAVKDANPIRMLSEGKALFVHTSQRTLKVYGANGVITPADVQVDTVADQGSNGAQAVNADRCLIFPDQSGTEMVEVSFDFDAGDDEARDLTRLANHILLPGG